MRRVQQGCHNELTNREDYPFSKLTKNIRTAKGQVLYSKVDGKINQVRIIINGHVYELPYKSEVSLFDDKTAKPECYTIQFNPEKIKLYPTPDDTYNIMKLDITYKDKNFDIELKPIFRQIAENQYIFSSKNTNTRTLKRVDSTGLDAQKDPNQ